MSHYQLKVTTRAELGHNVRKLRNEGFLPLVAYNKLSDAINLKVNHGEFIKAYKSVGSTGVLEITVDNNKKTLPCIVHDLHVHPVSHKLQHADLMIVDLKTKILADVPLEFIGESSAIKESGGILDTQRKSLKVEALPDNLPSIITVDINILRGHSDVIKISDLLKSNDYLIVEDENEVLASIVSETVENIEEPQSSSTTESAQNE
jgi:large subunit ribosomal protein L25